MSTTTAPINPGPEPDSYDEHDFDAGNDNGSRDLSMYDNIPEPPCDVAAAREFLHLYDPTAKWWTFQCFDDVKLPNGKPRGDKSLARIFHGPLDDAMAAQLAALNAFGAGVYFTPNQTDGKGRTKKNIRRVRAVWNDFDNKDGKPRVLRPIRPSLIVETSPGHTHEHWLVDELTIPEHAGIMEVMCEKYGSDPNTKDLPRVLRLPGFFHTKDLNNQRMVRLIGGADLLPGWPAVVYKRDELLKGFDYGAKPTPEPTPPREPGAFNRPKLWQLLGYIEAHEHETWIKVGMALHHESGGGLEGKELWLTWSPNAPEKFDETDLEKRWKSFHGAANPVTIGTLYLLAKKGGWKEPQIDKTAPFSEFESEPGADAKPASWRLFAPGAERWRDKTPTPPPFVIERLVPQDGVTLLVSAGGRGKSTIAQQLMNQVAIGGEFLGFKIRETGCAAGVFCEDSDNTLHWRQIRVCRGLGITLESIAQRVDPKSFVGSGKLLWENGTVTAFYHELDADLTAKGA
jgi:hypothetical protein